MNIIQRLSLLTAILAMPFISLAGEIKRELSSFSRIIVSPKINLVLMEGERESIELNYDRISPDKINIEIRGNTLHLYLDDARVTEKTKRLFEGGRQGIYKDVTITAYVTYVALRHLEIRGNQELTCTTPLRAEKFVIRAYGENEITLSSLKTGYLKTYLYGENRLNIDGGKADYQKYKLYGENRIDTKELKSYAARATIFGESRVRLHSHEELKVNSFGESDVWYDGEAFVNKGLIFGRTNIHRME